MPPGTFSVRNEKLVQGPFGEEGDLFRRGYHDRQRRKPGFIPMARCCFRLRWLWSSAGPSCTRESRKESDLQGCAAGREGQRRPRRPHQPGHEAARCVQHHDVRKYSWQVAVSQKNAVGRKLFSFWPSSSLAAGTTDRKSVV